MKKLAFKFEFLIVMNTVENVRAGLQNIIHDLRLGEIFRVIVHFCQHFRILGVSFLLELVIRINLITFRLKQPGHGLGVDHVLLILAHFKRVGAIEHFLIIDIVVIFAEQELDALLILFSFQIVKLQLHFVFFLLDYGVDVGGF